MCAAAARTEQKYSIPRNPLIPEQTALDILASGSLFKSPSGATEGYPIPLFRADSEAGAKFSMQQRGVLYYFKYGHIYVTDAAKTSMKQLMDGVSLSALFVLPGVADMAGGMPAFVEKGGDFLIEAVTEKATRKPAAKITFGEQIAIFERQGMVVLAGVNLVEVEYQIEPAGFMSKERHIHILTYVDSGVEPIHHGTVGTGGMHGCRDDDVVADGSQPLARICIESWVVTVFASNHPATRAASSSAFALGASRDMSGHRATPHTMQTTANRSDARMHRTCGSGLDAAREPNRHFRIDPGSTVHD